MTGSAIITLGLMGFSLLAIVVIIAGISILVILIQDWAVWRKMEIQRMKEEK